MRLTRIALGWVRACLDFGGRQATIEVIRHARCLQLSSCRYPCDKQRGSVEMMPLVVEAFLQCA